jgi:CelD/BcsL family acetyltransferase involved in cellulose biosynthesis
LPIFGIDPLTDGRWEEFLSRCPDSSVFHTTAWLKAMHRTYDYKPIVFTTSGPGGHIQNGIVCCHIRSWLTGHRVISLPFSDHCDPLFSPDDCGNLLELLTEVGDRECARYIELRPLSWEPKQWDGASRFAPSRSFAYHKLDLRPDLTEIWKGLHKNCIQRKILRAEREKLRCEIGRDDSTIREFYRLQVATRRRHGVPPQPIRWFRNLAAYFGDALQIFLAFKENHPIAGILALTNRRCVTYKYSCSNDAFRSLGGGPFLLWSLIKDAKARGMEELDLGRSDGTGLVAYKDRWGAKRTELTYWQHPAPLANRSSESRMSIVSHAVLKRMPFSVLSLAGEILYKHVG